MSTSGISYFQRREQELLEEIAKLRGDRVKTFNKVGVSVVPRPGVDIKPHCEEVLGLRDYLSGTIHIEIITVFNGRRIICRHDDTLETLIEQWEQYR